jgi:gliding motility-associated-like protein
MNKKITLLFLLFMTSFFLKAQVKSYQYPSESFNEATIIQILDNAKKSGTKDWELEQLKEHLYKRLENQQKRLYLGSTNTNNQKVIGTTPPNPMAACASCNNIGFENGTTSGWTLTSGDINGVNLPCNTCATNAGGIAAVTTTSNSGTTWAAGVDNCSGQPVVAPGGGAYSLCLNNNTSGGKMQEIKQTFLVSATNNVFTYQYLAVLQDGGHAASDQPYFFSQVTDASGNAIACTKVLQSASTAITGWIGSTNATCNAGGQVNYKGWITVTLDLTSYIGQCVTIEFLVSDCNQGGHYGYCYLDASCDQVQVNNTVNICPGSTQLCGPPGFNTYSWTGPTTGNAMCLNTSLAGAYTLVTTGQCPAPTRFYTVNVSPTPTVNFTSTVTPCNNTVPFTDMSTISGGATIASYSWTFGDGGTSTVQNPSHTYTGPGTYNVVETCTSSVGCVGTYSSTVTIGTGPTAAFSASTVCPGNPTVFTNTSTGATSYSWAFGNPAGGNSTAANPTYTYPEGAGNYSVVLTAMGTGTCVATKTLMVVVNPVPTATIGAPKVCMGSPTVFTSTINPTTGSTYNWTFGDGGTSTGSATPSHTYASSSTFPVTVTVTAAGGCTVTATTNAIVDPNPTASFSVAQVCQGTGSVFVNTSTSDSACVWTFGGAGNPAAASYVCAPTFTYSSSGTFPVTLHITAVGGCTATATGNAVVNPMPVLAFTATDVCDQTAVPITNTTASQGTFTVWAWDFGDGVGTSTAAAPGTYTYPAPGVYNITLTASTNTGCSGTVTHSVAVHPNPVFNGVFTNPCLGDITSVYDASTITNPPGLNDAITQWNWTFGDGQTAATSVDSVQHTYVTCGGFNLSYTVTTNFGCSASGSASDTVYCLPIVVAPASVTACPNTAVGNQTFITTVTNGGPAFSEWVAFSTHTGMPPADSSAGGFDMVPGYTSGQNLTCTNLIDTVAAIAISSQGCFGNADFYTVTLYPTPILSHMDSIKVCANQQVVVPAFVICPTGAVVNWTNNATSIGLAASGTGNIPSPFTGLNTTDQVIDALVTAHATLNTCVGPDSTFNIVVSPLPSMTVTPTLPYCPGDHVLSPTINTDPASTVNNPVILSWTVTNFTNIGMPQTGTGIPLPYTAPANASLVNQVGVITYVPSLNGCIGAPATETITIKPTPVIQPISNVFYCPGDHAPQINYACLPTGMGTPNYNWQITTAPYNVGVSPTTASGDSLPAFTANPNNTGVAQMATVTLGASLNNCPSSFANFVVTVYPTPIPQFSYVPVCDGQPMSFTDLSTPNSGSITVNQWAWDMNHDGIYNDATTQNPSYTVSPAGVDSVSLIVSTNSNPSCFAKVTEAVTVNPNPVAAFTADTTSGCPILPVNFTDHSSVTIAGVPAGSITSWSWSFGNGNTFNGQMPPMQTYTNSSPTAIASYTVSLTVTSTGGCVNTKTKPGYIKVFPRPIANFSWGPTDADIDDPTITFVNQEIGASGYPAAAPTVYGHYGVQYYLGDIYALNQNSNTVYGAPNNNVFSHVYEHYDTATYYVTQWVINSLGCKDSITKPVDIKPDFTFYIPNAFSPNGDGTNEGFKGTGVGIDNTTYNLWVFDRWGNMLFYSDDLEKAWDGHMRGNEDRPVLQEDVYVWKVRFNDFTGKKHDYHGTVTLLK